MFLKSRTVGKRVFFRKTGAPFVSFPENRTVKNRQQCINLNCQIMKSRKFLVAIMLFLIVPFIVNAAPVLCHCERSTGQNQNGHNTQDEYAYSADGDCCLGSAMTAAIHAQVEVYPGTWQTIESNYNVTASEVQKECCPEI